MMHGVLVPPDAEMAWLGACMAGADGWVSVCVGILVLVVHGTNAWFVRRGARGVCGVAFLDWSDG
jgi:hypothetical protein